jgi:hypothetical protein
MLSITGYGRRTFLLFPMSISFVQNRRIEKAKEKVKVRMNSSVNTSSFLLDVHNTHHDTVFNCTLKFHIITVLYAVARKNPEFMYL